MRKASQKKESFSLAINDFKNSEWMAIDIASKIKKIGNLKLISFSERWLNQIIK